MGLAAGAAANPPPPQHIGVIVVHGIGEQRRFEHLDWQGRDLIRAIMNQPGVEITVEIGSGAAAPFHAEQATWADGAHGPVQVFVRSGGRITHCLHFHEVWWADINERYSLAKQIRFWLWGLAIWAYPRGTGPRLHGTAAVTSPSAPGLAEPHNWLWQRARLFMVGVFFLVSAFPLGIGLLVIQRLLNLRTPDILKTMTNYISGVKLFNQHSRYGPGFAPHPPNEDFLDTLDEPPRVSVRRRVIRTIATVARANYDCWYVVAHSQGTVAAFNGLMETPYAWPGYFDEATWLDFRNAGFGGPGNIPADATGDTMPRRPVWAPADEVAYRARIFSRFRGLLTLGSPLEKFAAIWPARVPIARIPAFRGNTVWINVFDPLDPVSGVLLAYAGHPTAVCPAPTNVGYAAYPLLLLAHLRYVTWTGLGCLGDGVGRWLLTGDAAGITTGAGRFQPDDMRRRWRSVAAWLWWLAAFAVIAFTGGWSVRLVWSWWVTPASCDCTPPLPLPDRLEAAWQWMWQPRSLVSAAIVVIVAIAGTALVGWYSRERRFRGDLDPEAAGPDGGPIDDVDPDPPVLPAWPAA